MPAGVIVRFAVNRDGMFWKYRSSEKERAVVFPAIEAMANANSKWSTRCHDANGSAKAATGKLIHVASPLGQPRPILESSEARSPPKRS